MNKFVFVFRNSSNFRTTRDRSCDCYSDRENSKFFNRRPIVHRRLWTKDHDIFHSCKSPQGLSM